MSKQIDPSRQTMYYLGMAILLTGALLFVGGMVWQMTQMGQHANTMPELPDMPGALPGVHGTVVQSSDLPPALIGKRRSGHDGSMFTTFVVWGFVLMVAGTLLRRVGSQGLAGSGLVLDPEQARQDLEPFSRQTGGMVKDALDEADIHLGGQTVREVIKVKCRACGHLNDEHAKFCQECGARM